MPAALNAANEVAVGSFLDGEIGFNEIAAVIKETMDSHENGAADDLGAVMAAHDDAAGRARGFVNSRAAINN
jgi:1-deoxy-D-xylulose-5-phosphate reductoisomerase